MKVSFGQGPALIYDICTIIIAKTNPQKKWIQRHICEESKDVDVDYVLRILYQVPALDARVYLFSNEELSNVSLLTMLFQDYLDFCQGNCSVEEFCEYLQNEARLIKNFGLYYFDTEIEQKALLFDFIYESDISGEENLRAQMLEFAAFTDRYISILVQTVKDIAIIFEGIRKEMADSIFKVQEVFQYEDFLQKLGRKTEKEKESAVYISFTLVNRYLIWKHNFEGKVLYILGANYGQTIHELNGHHIDLTEFSNALGEKMRRNILDLIIQNKEMSVSDIIRGTGAAPATVMYHLDILKNAKVVKYRSQGRKVLYWLNTDQYQLAIQKLAEEIKKWEGESS